MFKVIENFLPSFSFDRIKNTIMDNQYFPFYYHHYVARDSNEEKKDIKQLCFVHSLYSNKKIQSHFFDSIAYPLIDALKIKDGNLIRIKVNLNVNQQEQIKSHWHTDCTEPHTTALLYLNTNNGYTEFEDNKKVESVANRMIIFDGQTKHRGVTQTNTKSRYAININYETN